ncbi:Complement C3 [Acipenser ruthenus]|uniref:Complement C3 n=1 Tax=Acipenser ruthenus TaxID=7906 RepID=A0A444UX57_ACIRT|nr:Complement C3 [Acipenser ruthenus]
MSLTVTKAMVPSFRIVAYYYVKKGGQEELVSDSVWVDVTDSCIGELLVEPYRSTDVGKIYRPGNSFELKISGDPGAKVGLVAVDKAVFLLNNKNKLTQSKVRFYKERVYHFTSLIITDGNRVCVCVHVSVCIHKHVVYVHLYL